MFGLSNNKQDNQDDQVMLKNVSKLATDLQSNGSSTPATQDAATTSPSPSIDPAASPTNQPQPTQLPQEPVATPAFPPAQTQSTDDTPATPPPVTAPEPPAPAVQQPEPANTEESPLEAPSSFSFPSLPSTDDDATTQSDDSTTTDHASSIEQTSLDQDESAPRAEESVLNTPITGHASQTTQPVASDGNDSDDATSAEEGAEETNTKESSLPPAPSNPVQTQEEAGTTMSAPIDTEKLNAMKQQAMEHLDPLVDHLDQSPEETFKTTMMMIQANDNHHLLDKALEAAKNITDDKERAQAMLDIINEINYFSQNSQDS